MKNLLLAAGVAVLGLFASASTASAQHNRNVIGNSGNGINNTIVAQNRGGLSGPFVPVGGRNTNVISNSGNGIGNTIVASNSGGGFGILPGGCYFPGGGYPGGSFPGGPVFPGGVNVNVVTNSGNGVGNTILTGNSRPGGLNINVVTNSGNGVGNVISTRNGR